MCVLCDCFGNRLWKLELMWPVRRRISKENIDEINEDLAIAQRLYRYVSISVSVCTLHQSLV